MNGRPNKAQVNRAQTKHTTLALRGSTTPTRAGLMKEKGNLMLPFSFLLLSEA